MGQHTFISYSRQDQEFALKLASDLRRSGANIWIDQVDIKPGTDWDIAVEEALYSCEVFLFILSPASVQSKDVRDELNVAISEGKQILPVLYKPCRIPLRIHRLQYIDFTNHYDTALEKLRQVFAVVEPPAPKTAPAKSKKTETRREVVAETPLKISKPVFRSTPEENLSESAVAQMLRKYDFYCGEYDWRPNKFKHPGGKGFPNQFELQLNGQVVYDRASNLMWQQSGSSKYMRYDKTQAYIDQLNRDKFAGFDDWRLPTLEEAMSLMEPMQHKKLFIDPVFDERQEWIWTADQPGRASAAWAVDFYDGYCLYVHVDSDYYVRAVRSGQSS